MKKLLFITLLGITFASCAAPEFGHTRKNDRKDKWATHIPEGVKNQLVPLSDSHRGLLTHCWKMIKNTVGVCELCYRRGMQDN